ncbi:pleckstrin homology domain-containing family A member 7-like, partial [Anarrhichthys ocellatus]|uniref:pleckstrin homology domain-containing family A member 7-like n=1 Tax=Anarrhichthys ocellatus TaxID=433405 RepID=UPI0012EE1889
MAADPKPDWLSCLPSSWSYGVTRDGRIFFINEEAKSTTWLHPVTGEAVITGHRKTPGKRSENVLFFICENTRTRAAPGKGCPRVTVEKKGDKLRRERRKTMRGDLFSLQQSNSLLCSAPSLLSS